MACVNSFTVRNYVNYFYYFCISLSVAYICLSVSPFYPIIHIFHHSISCFPSRPSFLPYLFTHFLAFMHIN